MPVDPANLARDLAAIAKTYGGSAVEMGDKTPKLARIPTGSYELDYVTGGGIPIGRFTRFWGGYKSSKSLTGWNVIREAQKMGMSCAYYNLEKQYHREFVQERGVNVKKLVLMQGSTIEEVGAKLEATLGSINVHVIDSLSSGTSIDELAAKIEDWQMGLRARAWGKVLNRALSRLDDRENVVIMIDQARDTFGAGGEHPPNGRLVEHTSSMTLYFKRGAWLFPTESGELDAKGDKVEGASGMMEPQGMEIQVRCMKSRVSAPFRSARLKIDFATMSFDAVDELARCGVHFGVIPHSGGGRYELPGGEKVHGRSKLRERIRDDEELRNTIAAAMKARW